MSKENTETCKFLIKQLYELCKDDRLKKNSIDKSQTFWVTEGILFCIDKQDLEIYNSIIQKIIIKEYIKQDYTIDELKRRVNDIIYRCLMVDLSKREEKIRNEIINFRKNRIEEIKDFNVLIPIINLDIKRPIRIGNVKIYQYNNSFEKRLLKTIRATTQSNFRLNLKNVIKENFVKDMMSIIERGNDSRSLCYAEINVKCLNHICRENALNEARIAINVLKLFWENEDERLSRYFGIKGETIDLELRCIPQYATDFSSMNYHSEHVGSLDVYKLDEKKRNYMRKEGFNQICDILLKSSKNEIETSLLKAIYWFGESTNIRIIQSKKLEEKYNNLNGFQLYEKFLKLFIALESLLNFSENEPTTHIISERVALLLGKNYESKMNFQKEIKELYKYRSNIVHTGKSERINISYLFKLQSIVQKVIFYLLKNKGDLNTKEDLKNYLDKIKYS